MANTKISGATETTTLASTDEVPVASSGASKKITGANLQASTIKATQFGHFNTAVPSGCLAQTFPRELALTNGSLLLSQRLHLMSIWLPAGLTVTSITFYAATTALSGGNHQFFSLHDDPSGTTSSTAYGRLAVSADDTSTAWSANSAKTLAMTSPYVTTRTGLFYIGILVDAATVPTLWCATASSANTPNSLTPVIVGTSSTGQTSVPSAPAAPTYADKPIWAMIK